MIKLRIIDDEFKHYAEDYSVSEFQSTNAIEYFTTGETQSPPPEQINIQEDSGFAQSADRSEALRDGQNFNNNNNNTQSNTDSGSSSSSSSSSSSDGGSSSSGGTSSSSTSSGTSSGANVTGGEATATTAGSSVAGASAGAGAGATAATAGTATAATVAGSITVVAAAICAIVAVTANIIKMAPTVIMSYFMAGTNYIQYVLDVSDLDDEVDYIISLSNPNFSYTYDLREDLTEDGKVEGLISGLTPHRSYKLQVLSVAELGNVPHFTYEFITQSEPKPEAVPRVEANIDYDNKTFNLDYNIFISDAYHTGSNTFVEFYVNETLFSTDSNIDKNGYIIGQLQRLPNSSTVKGYVKTTYEEAETEIGYIEYKVVYPKEIITEALAFKATYSEDPEVETSIGTSADCYQYVYAINTAFDNSAQTTDKYLLEVVGANNTVLDSYTGTSAMVSCAVDYDVEEAYVYLTPISVVNDEEITFERKLLKTISNAPFISYTGFVMRPGKDFIFTTKMAPEMMQEELICSYSIGEASPIETGLVDGQVEVFGNSSTQTSILFQIVDSTGRIAGKRIIDLTQTSSLELSFHANGDFNLTEGFTIETEFDETPTLGEGEGYRLIVRDENDKFLGMGATITNSFDNQTLSIPDLSHTFYRAALASTKIVNGVEYVFESSANTDGCEHLFVPFEEGSLMFNGSSTSSILFGLSVGTIFSGDNIDITGTVTSTYQDSTTSSFSLDIPYTLEGDSTQEEITSEQWNNLSKVDVVITNDAGTIVYGRYTYTKSGTLLAVTNYGVKNKKLTMNVSVPNCPEDSSISYLAFKEGSGSSIMISDPITHEAVQEGDDWIVTIEEIKSLTLAGLWEYSFNMNGLEVSVTDFVETSESLNIQPTVKYYLSGETAHDAETSHKVYVDGYPTYNGKEINLSNWSLSFYEDDTYSTPMMLSNESDSIGLTSSIEYTLLYLQNPVEDAFYYKMTYGGENTVLESSGITLPSGAYDESLNYESVDDPTCYGTYISNAVTFNLAGTTVVSTNMYNTYHITSEETGMHYQARVGYNFDYGYDMYRTDFDADNPYIAIEDLPYKSSYIYELHAFKTVTIDDTPYDIYLGPVLDSYTVSTMIVDGAYNAVHGILSGPSLTDNGIDQQYIDIMTVADYLVAGKSLELYWGSSDTPIEIDPQTVMGLEYAEHDYDQSVDGLCTVIINNNQAKPTETCSVAVQVLFTDYLSDTSGSKLIVKNKARTGGTELAEYNITTKGYVFALQDAGYTLKDANGNIVEFTEYTLGEVGTAHLYAVDSEVTLITEYTIA
ncbi:MAG: hypothetical protein J5656_01135 [Clostridia bacterium]|nr:hypothetical protein [Clostridia bacterium]